MIWEVLPPLFFGSTPKCLKDFQFFGLPLALTSPRWNPRCFWSTHLLCAISETWEPFAPLITPWEDTKSCSWIIAPFQEPYIYIYGHPPPPRSTFLMSDMNSYNWNYLENSSSSTFTWIQPGFFFWDFQVNY